MSQTIGLEPSHNTSLRWLIGIDYPEITELRQKHPNISDEEFNRTLRSAANILSQCPNPESKNGIVTGLAIGKVQSGKTLSFTTLIALAAANRYKRIIVLAGTKNALLTQTFDRLKKHLGIAEPSRASQIIAYDNPTIAKSDAIYNAITGNKCVLLVVLKHASRIKDVRELVSSKEIQQIPTLIIDDEGDEASLNNYFRQGRQSATYQSILDLRNALPTHAYIAYTATPQANLLLQDIDDLSPNFCELIEPGRGYCGGLRFFGINNINNFIREISDMSEQGLEEGYIPDSLKDALAIFFTGAAIRHIRSQAQKHSMLIHMTHLRRGHEQAKNTITQLLRKWIEIFSLRPNDPVRQELMHKLKQAYEDLERTVSNPPSWQEVEGRLCQELLSCELHMVNSLPEGVQIAETTFQFENNIVIGGNILGRGITIQYLTVSYMSRRARRTTNVDTMEQRARWFGYKEEYLDLCRIYLPRQIIDDYSRILVQEDDFWDSLERNIRQGIPIHDWVRFFKDTGLNLHPTRSSVAQFKRFHPSGWEQQNIPVNDSAAVVRNEVIISKFFNDQNAKEEDIGNTKHKFVRNCDVTKVINLLRQLELDDTDWDSAYFLEYLHRLVTEDRLNNIDVVLMVNGTERRRRFSDGKIDQLMQGPYPADGTRYPGDRNFHNNKVQLQVHIVIYTDKNGNKIGKTTALALYIPEGPQFDMSYVIRGEL